MSDGAIRVDGLGKLYCIGPRERYKALRDTLTGAAPNDQTDQMNGIDRTDEKDGTDQIDAIVSPVPLVPRVSPVLQTRQTK
jgi:hypothetical protein